METVETEINKKALATLKEKHVQFLLADLKGERLQQQIEIQVAETFEWLQNTTLNDLVDVEWLKTLIHRSVKNAPYTQRLHELIVKGIVVGVNADVNRSTTLATLIPKEEFDDFVIHLAQFEEVRIDFIRAILQSPIYSELISDVLYFGIKDYVMNENVVTKKVPGVSSLMKMGAKGINKAMPNLENLAESTVKKYIESNINRTLTLSEKILNNSLNEHNIKKVADHFWEAVEAKEFSLAAAYVDEDAIDKSAELAKRLWLKLREAEYIHNIIDVIVDDFFTENGAGNIADMLNALGFDQAYVTAEIKNHLPDLLGKASVNQYIESRIRSSLNRFYDSVDVIA